MEFMFGIGALLLLGAIAYGIHQSKSRRRAKGDLLPEEKVDRQA